MQLEDYFEFRDAGDIRIKGTRIGIETVITDYQRGKFPEQIVASYHPAITLEQVYAALTYYLHNRSSLDDYLARTDEQFEAAREQQQEQAAPPVVQRLRDVKAKSERAKS